MTCMACMTFTVCIVCMCLVSIYLYYFTLFFYMLQDCYIFDFILFFLFSFLLFYKRIRGCWSTLTKARALKEGKKNIFRGKMGLMWLHTYGKRRFYIDGDSKPSKRKTKKGRKRKKKEDFPPTDWVFLRLIYIRKKRIAKGRERGLSS